MTNEGYVPTQTLARIALAYAQQAVIKNSLALLETAHQLVDVARQAEWLTYNRAEPEPLRATFRWSRGLHRAMNRLWQHKHPGVLGLFRPNLTGSVFLSATDTGYEVIAVDPEPWRESDRITILGPLLAGFEGPDEFELDAQLDSARCICRRSARKHIQWLGRFAACEATGS